DSASTRERRLPLALLCCGLVAVPFLAVQFPPITDLPQHVAQIRLLLETMRDPSSHYMVQWYTPYSLAYALIGAAWALVPPAEVGRVAVLGLAVFWTLATHALAARRGRSGAAAALASTLVFNLVLYWGFLSFAFGWLAFVPWFLLVSRPAEEPFRWTDA